MLISLLGTIGTFVFLLLLFLVMIAKIIFVLQGVKAKDCDMYNFYLTLDVIAYMIVLVSFALGKI